MGGCAKWPGSGRGCGGRGRGDARGEHRAGQPFHRDRWGTAVWEPSQGPSGSAPDAQSCPGPLASVRQGRTAETYFHSRHGRLPASVPTQRTPRQPPPTPSLGFTVWVPQLGSVAGTLPSGAETAGHQLPAGGVGPVGTEVRGGHAGAEGWRKCPCAPTPTQDTAGHQLGDPRKGRVGVAPGRHQTGVPPPLLRSIGL